MQRGIGPIEFPLLSPFFPPPPLPSSPPLHSPPLSSSLFSSSPQIRTKNVLGALDNCIAESEPVEFPLSLPSPLPLLLSPCFPFLFSLLAKFLLFILFLYFFQFLNPELSFTPFRDLMLWTILKML